MRVVIADEAWSVPWILPRNLDPVLPPKKKCTAAAAAAAQTVTATTAFSSQESVFEHVVKRR
eukprot:5698434-Prorocentrum_lima.AAC.1